MTGIFNTLFRYREKKSPDRLGLFPESVDIQAMPERRYLWTSRVLVIFCALSFSVTIMLASTLYLLLPQRGARPELLTTNRFFSRLEKSEPLERNIGVMDLVTEKYIEKYVKLRHEIPKSQAELYNIWRTGSEFYWLSSLGVFQSFSAKATSDQVNKFIIRGLTRKVEIEWIKQIGTKLWQVQFVTINTVPQRKDPQVIIWRAYLRIDFEDVDMENKEALTFNPFGFKVKNYSLAYVGTPQKPTSYLETAKQIREQNYRY